MHVNHEIKNKIDEKSKPKVHNNKCFISISNMIDQDDFDRSEPNIISF